MNQLSRHKGGDIKMSQRNYVRGKYPTKRKIRKLSYRGTIGLVAGLQQTTLASSDEDETLVRIVGTITYAMDTALGVGNIDIIIKQGGNIPGDLVDGTVVHDGRDAANELWIDRFGNAVTAESLKQKIDVKGMRKMEKADTIVIRTRASVADMGSAHYALTMFFKKA